MQWVCGLFLTDNISWSVLEFDLGIPIMHVRLPYNSCGVLAWCYNFNNIIKMMCISSNLSVVSVLIANFQIHCFDFENLGLGNLLLCCVRLHLPKICWFLTYFSHKNLFVSMINCFWNFIGRHQGFNLEICHYNEVCFTLEWVVMLF